MVMALYAIAEAIEARAVDRARNAISGLLDLSPPQAEVLNQAGAWQILPVEQVAVGSVVRVKPGLPVYFTILGEPQRRYEAKLRVAMTTQVFVVLNRADQALVIPATALGQRDRKAGTYEVRVLEGEGKDQKVSTRNVKIGLNNRVQAQVLEGLKAGEKVVVGESGANGAGAGAGAARMPRMF